MNIAAREDRAIGVLANAVDVHRTWNLGRTKVQALKGVSVEVRSGELLAICGPSGSGKTTLLNLLGLLDRPDQGDVLLLENSAMNLSESKRASLRSQTLGFVFQSFNLLPVLDALENVMMPLWVAGKFDKSAADHAKELLDAVGLSSQMHQRPDRMSGGQRQRVALARALVMKPSLVLADEPTANLDSESSNQVMELIEELNRSTKTAFVFSTHDDRVVTRVHRCVQLRDGLVETENLIGIES